MGLAGLRDRQDAVCFDGSPFGRQYCCGNRSAVATAACWDTLFAPRQCCATHYACWPPGLSAADCCGPLDTAPQSCLETFGHALRRALCCGDFGVIGGATSGDRSLRGVAQTASIGQNGFVGEHVLSIEEAYQRAQIRVGAPICGSAELIANELAAHVALLYDFARRSEYIVELGVRTATSAVAWIRGLRDNGSERKVLRLVDLVLHPRILASRLALARRAGVDAQFAQANSLAYVIPDPPCDLLFVDTLHAYGQLRRELARHAPSVRRWILLHDTGLYGSRGECAEAAMAGACSQQSADFGVPPEELSRGLAGAVREFLGAGRREWELESALDSVGTGLTVLRRISSPM